MMLFLRKKIKHKIILRKMVLYFSLFFLTAIANAAEELTSPVSYSSNVVQMIIGLMATIVMIFVVVWLIKRVGYTGYTSTNAMKIKSTLALSSKEKLVLIEVDGEKILIGTAPGFVGLVKTLNSSPAIIESEVRSAVTDEPNREETINFSHGGGKPIDDLTSSFAEKLKAVLNKGELIK